MQLKLTLTLILLLCLSSTWARKLVVTSTDDNVSTPIEGMLRYHINNAVKDDTIVFDVTRVTLAGEISISSKSIVIDGGTGVTLDAQQSDRIFNITSYSASNKLEIKNLNLINGKKSGDLVTGGAMRVHLSSGELTVENCVFENNTVEATSDGQGGALRTNGGTFINCSFLNNHVTGTTSVLGGGGIFAIGNAKFINCVIAGNSAKYGGGIYSSGTAQFINCTITDNSTPEADKGGGISNEGSTYTNCIILGNTSGGATNNIRHYDGSYTNCAMEQGNALATSSNIGLSASPFVSGTAPYDLSLINDSECIDAGTVTGVTVTSFDIAGSARISGNTIDIGAYEFSVAKPALPKYATLPFSEDFETDWIDFEDTRDVPSKYWRNSPATGDNSWSREDDGQVRGAWSGSINLFGYYPYGANGSKHSAAFNSNASLGQRGYLDLHVDFSTMKDEKALYFYYINTDGEDGLYISVSEDGGISYSQTLAVFKLTKGWQRCAVNLGNLSSKKGIIRFRANSGYSQSSRIGIDNVSVGAHTSTPIVADFTTNVTSGFAPLEVQFTDHSTGDVTSWQWDFDGDGRTDATNASPSNIYTEAGTYTVKLTTSKPGHIDSKTMTIEVIPQEYATLPFHEGFDDDWIDRETTRDVPSRFFRTSPATGKNTWRRYDAHESHSPGSYSLTTAYLPSGALNTNYSARYFNEYRSYATANLDLYVDFSSQSGEKNLSFWYINSKNALGNEKLEVLLSTDNGETFTAPLVTKNAEDVWTKVSCSLGNITASNGVIRFRASSTGGLHMGIDEVKVHVPATVDVEAHFTGTNLSGPAPLTVNLTDESDGVPTEWSWDLNGDGTIDATTQNPSFTYAEPGLYPVSLTVSKQGSTSSKTIEKIVFVAGPAALPFYESFDEEWVTRNANRDVPGIHWNNTPATGDNSWSRIDDGVLRGAWTTKSLTYNVLGALGTRYSAGYNSRDGSKKTGSLDLSIDFSSQTGNKRLEFWFVNTEGTDSLEVIYSGDGGASFGYPLKILKTNKLWERIVVNLGEINDENGVIRLKAHGGASPSSMMGIDELKIYAPTLLPLKADFTTNVTSGAAPLTVHFTNASEGDIEVYEWDFNGDGIADATTPSPSYEFTEPGVYNVSLTVRNAEGAHTKTAERLIVVPGYTSLPFLESFEATWVSRDLNRDVPSHFARNSHPHTGWSRDDDLVARGAFPSMGDNYDPAGANGTEHSARAPYDSWRNRALDFYIDFSSMEGDKTLTFWSKLPNNRLSVSLSLDGGATFGEKLLVLKGQLDWTKSTLNLGEINAPEGVLRFLSEGGYRWEHEDMDSGLDEVGINVLQADFTANVTSGDLPLTVTFEDLSTFGPTTWAWDFNNDGVVDATSQNPEYTFTEPGVYTVVLKATNAYSGDRIVKTDFISVTVEPVVADFSADITSGVAPLTVTFQDLSTNDPSDWEWDFDNDGVVDAVTQNPEYTFTEPGDYTVALSASRELSSDRVVKTSFITVTAVTGLENIPFDGFSLYPNPTKGVVYIVAPNGTTNIQRIEMVDLAGVVLVVIDASELNGQSIDLSPLPDGAVFVRFVCNDRILTHKLIIRK